MRSALDRLRHTLLFEIIGLMIVMPLGSRVFGLSLEHMGGVAVISVITAAVWNYLYNLGVDALLTRWRGTTNKTLPLRLAHAFLFEAGLLLILQPMIMLYLGRGTLATLGVTLSLALFYMCYAFFYNLAYDWIFPVRQAGQPGTLA